MIRFEPLVVFVCAALTSEPRSISLCEQFMHPNDSQLWWHRYHDVTRRYPVDHSDSLRFVCTATTS